MKKPGLRRSRGRADTRTADQVSCPICGLRNEGRTRFCRNCGLPMGTGADPVRGTKTRRPELPGDRGAGIGAIIGLVVAVVVLAGAGFLIVRTTGDIGSRPTLPPTPPPSAAPAEPTAAPEVTAEPGGGTASAEPVTPPSGVAPDTGFTCKRAGFDDPTSGSWKVTGVVAEAGDRMDTLTMTLTREEGAGSTTIAIERGKSKEVQAAAQLEDSLGTPKALLISFDGDAFADDLFADTPALKAIEQYDVASTSGRLFAAVGVKGEGCYRLYSPEWAAGTQVQPGETVTLVLEVRYK